MREGHQAGALLSPFLLKKGWDEDAAEDRRHQIAFRDRSFACLHQHGDLPESALRVANKT